MAADLRLLDKKIILINSLKGGAGKSTIGFCILKYLISLQHKVLVYDFDRLNRGMLGYIKKYLSKHERAYVSVVDMSARAFFDHSIHIVQQIYLEYDYIIVDGHICSIHFNRVLKLRSCVLQVIYIIPDDLTIHVDELNLVVAQYTNSLKNRLLYFFNMPNKRERTLRSHKKMVMDTIQQIIRTSNIQERHAPKIADNIVEHFADIENLFKQYMFVSQYLLES